MWQIVIFIALLYSSETGTKYSDICLIAVAYGLWLEHWSLNLEYWVTISSAALTREPGRATGDRNSLERWFQARETGSIASGKTSGVFNLTKPSPHSLICCGNSYTGKSPMKNLAMYPHIWFMQHIIYRGSWCDIWVWKSLPETISCPDTVKCTNFELIGHSSYVRHLIKRRDLTRKIEFVV